MNKMEKIYIGVYFADENVKEIAKVMSEKGIHWYYFDKTADEDFEIGQLCEHYNIVFKYMERVK